MGRVRERVDFFAVLNGFLLVLAIAGFVVMSVALGVSITSFVQDRGVVGHAVPKFSPSAPATARNTALPAPPVIKTHTYKFSKTSDLRAFKQAGFGTAAVTGGKLRLAPTPAATKSVSLTVYVEAGSEVSFDSDQSGDVEYDNAQFNIDDMNYINQSGTAGGSAKYQRYPLSPGKHTLVWSYKTDNTINLPTDHFSIDNLRITQVLESPSWR